MNELSDMSYMQQKQADSSMLPSVIHILLFGSGLQVLSLIRYNTGRMGKMRLHDRQRIGVNLPPHADLSTFISLTL